MLLVKTTNCGMLPHLVVVVRFTIHSIRLNDEEYLISKLWSPKNLLRKRNPLQNCDDPASLIH